MRIGEKQSKFNKKIGKKKDSGKPNKNSYIDKLKKANDKIKSFNL